VTDQPAHEGGPGLRPEVHHRVAAEDEVERRIVSQRERFDHLVNEMDTERSSWEKKVLELEKENNSLRLQNIDNLGKYNSMKAREEVFVREASKAKEGMREIIEAGKRTEAEYRDQISLLGKEVQKKAAEIIELKDGFEKERTDRKTEAAVREKHISELEAQIRSGAEEIKGLTGRLDSEVSTKKKSSSKNA